MKKRPAQLAALKTPVAVEVIERRIFFIRSQKVMLDRDLAKLYGVPTRRLNEQVKRNRKRFPPDFMFQLTLEEAKAVPSLRSQNAILKRGQHIKYAPYAFTEQGVAMLSSVLRSERAIEVNIIIMRAFVKLREILATHKELAEKLDAIEKKYEKHDIQIKAVFDAIRKLIEAPATTHRQPIGFVSAKRAMR
jgi:phage regulator Rha-like protein